MTDEIVVIAPKDLTETKALSKDLSLSALMPQALKKKPEDVMAIVLTGAELGLAPMQAIRGIHIINGKASLSADLMGALVKRSPLCEYLQFSETSAKIATVRTKRRGDPGETVLSFTADQAQAAGLTGNPTYKKFPDAMLRARALSAICRAVYPDLCLGLYDSDSGEIEAPVEREVAPQAAHVQSIKDQIRAQVAAPKAEIEDAEIIEERAANRPWPEQIAGAGTLDELRALFPAIRRDCGDLPAEKSEELKNLYRARNAELTAGSPE